MDIIDELIESIEAAYDYGNPDLARMLKTAQRTIEYYRSCVETLTEASEKDTIRLDWLADVDNHIGTVQLPTECVERNIHSLRDAIDDAMTMWRNSQN